MKHLLVLILSILAIAPAVANPAGPVLVQEDLHAPGDGLITLDRNTGLQWLDLTATQGLSVEDIEKGAGGWLPLGFRYATFDEIKTLYADVGMVASPGCPYNSPTACYMQGSYDDGARFFDLLYGSPVDRIGGFEAPTPCGSWHSNVCDDHMENGQWVPTENHTYLMAVNLNPEHGVVTVDPSGPTATYTTIYPWAGSWLVHDSILPVPEPSSPLMIVCGLALIALLQKRRGTKF
jgi:hypothetical protein